MQVNVELVDHLARLSRLEYSAAEKMEILDDLEQMIQFVEKLNEIDTTGIDPVLHMSEEVNRLRDDNIFGSIPASDALKNAGDSQGNFFTVPKVIKKEDL